MVYPAIGPENYSITWKMRATRSTDFFAKLPPRVQNSVADHLSPSTAELRVLSIVQRKLAYVRTRHSWGWPRSLTEAAREIIATHLNALPWIADTIFVPVVQHILRIGRLAEALVWKTRVCVLGVNRSDTLQKLCSDTLIDVKRSAVPVVANPALINYYHLPIRNCSFVREGFSLRDNNIVYLSRDLLIMDNHWMQESSSDPGTLMPMVCIRS